MKRRRMDLYLFVVSLDIAKTFYDARRSSVRF